jgi:UDP-arabinose 4-epimerase
METVLVTGGAGFIGSHTCKALAAHGFLPVAFDDLSKGQAEFVRWGSLVQGDILDPAALDAAFARHRPGAVIHFAALAYVGESMSQPLAYYRVNVVGLVNVVEAMLRHGADTIVFSSSCAAYGIPDLLPIAESAPQRPINPYGRSELAGEQILGDARAAHGLRVAMLRYFNAAGADPDGELFERHDPETHLIQIQVASRPTPAGPRRTAVYSWTGMKGSSPESDLQSISELAARPRP